MALLDFLCDILSDEFSLFLVFLMREVFLIFSTLPYLIGGRGGSEAASSKEGTGIVGFGATYVVMLIAGA